MTLKLLDFPDDELRDLYAADLVLVRPDQIVAWRGNDDDTAQSVIATVLGL